MRADAKHSRQSCFKWKAFMNLTKLHVRASFVTFIWMANMYKGTKPHFTGRYLRMFRKSFQFHKRTHHIVISIIFTHYRVNPATVSVLKAEHRKQWYGRGVEHRLFQTISIIIEPNYSNVMFLSLNCNRRCIVTDEAKSTCFKPFEILNIGTFEAFAWLTMLSCSTEHELAVIEYLVPNGLTKIGKLQRFF